MRQSVLTLLSAFTVAADGRIRLPGGRLPKIDRIDKSVAADGKATIVQLYAAAG